MNHIFLKQKRLSSIFSYITALKSNYPHKSGSSVHLQTANCIANDLINVIKHQIFQKLSSHRKYPENLLNIKNTPTYILLKQSEYFYGLSHIFRTEINPSQIMQIFTKLVTANNRKYDRKAYVAQALYNSLRRRFNKSPQMICGLNVPKKNR